MKTRTRTAVALCLVGLATLLPGCSTSDPVAQTNDEIVLFALFVPNDDPLFEFRVVLKAIVQSPTSGVRRDGVLVLFRITEGAGILDKTEVMTNDNGEAFVQVLASSETITVEALSGSARATIDMDESGASVGQNQPPTAVLNFTPSSPRVNQDVTFDVSDSTDPEEDLDTWQITDYGDGNTSQQFKFSDRTSVTYSYSSSDTYEATVLVTDGGGRSDTDTRTVTVSP
jgi:hypothetical protein